MGVLKVVMDAAALSLVSAAADMFDYLGAIMGALCHSWEGGRYIQGHVRWVERGWWSGGWVSG